MIRTATLMMRPQREPDDGTQGRGEVTGELAALARYLLNRVLRYLSMKTLGSSPLSSFHL